MEKDGKIFCDACEGEIPKIELTGIIMGMTKIKNGKKWQFPFHFCDDICLSGIEESHLFSEIPPHVR